jgi:hypothetical protein
MALGNSKARTFKRPSSSSSNLSTSPNPTHGSSGQFLMSKINKYKFFAPRQHQQRLVRILTIKENMFYLYLTTKYANIVLARKETIRNCPSFFNHH